MTVPFPPGIPAELQQSLSWRQISPTGWQPLGGWQMSTPVGPYGKHERLQQLPPQLGTPASLSVPPSFAAPPHDSPATMHCDPPGAAGTEHVPSVIPAFFVQSPPQHSPSVEHTSPVCVQNDDWLEQRPFTQRCEQQSPLVEHVLPEVLHELLSGVHVLPASAPPSPPATGLQEPPQQLAFEVHGWLSEMHSCELHLPLVQTNEQHSLLVAQLPPAWTHWPTGFAQTWSVASHSDEQHCALPVHDCPMGKHAPPSPPPPSPTFPSPSVPSVPPPSCGVAPSPSEPSIGAAPSPPPPSSVGCCVESSPPQPASCDSIAGAVKARSAAYVQKRRFMVT
jgi:hypothetical protein